ncbi:MAG: tetratricopeptide repeat protein [Deltaproteobacteria bacterium]|nr:tetratricopeptide repeat protein [Deltaproteobacteria bacterium]
MRRRSSGPDRAPASAHAVEAVFVGAAACASCHPGEAAAWTGSHHQLAMQPANASTVLADFAGASFTHDGVASTFSRRGGAYVVRTDGPDGGLHDYDVKYTFGVAPLQQYLVAFPGGRLQSPEVAWDSRPAAAGGQRWFHLYPGEHLTRTDPLHWTGATENWNYMCADCHSTNVRKGWSAESASYATRFAEVSVACEACHGPGSRHVAWATAPAELRAAGTRGLAISLDERAGVAWPRAAESHKPARSRPRATEREIEMCARCHARRGVIHEDSVHGQPVGDDYRIALLDDGLYFPDGQIRDEVYEYGSFVQSRMYAEGVTCSDCHDPHRGTLREPGDGVCLRCHDASYATEKHHFHAASSAGARCTSCHMPTRTYMVVDARHDHSIRVPAPALSEQLGVPNACNGCHADRSAAWAARTVERWYGHAPSGHQRFAEALAAAARGAPESHGLLMDVIADRRQPAIARASAIARLDAPAAPATLPRLREALGDASPLVRGATVRALAGTDPHAIAPLLEDPVRAVRLEAAEALAGVPADLLPDARRGPLERAIGELVATHELNGDRPEAHLALATLHGRRKDLARAEAELARALAIDPAFTPAAVNLADLYRTMGRDADAERVLRGALVRAPDHAAVLHALGLVLVRGRRLPEALEALGRAARASDEPRYGYVFAVALHDGGRRVEALRELERVIRHRPNDRLTLGALVAFHREAGDVRAALHHAERLAELDPEDDAIRALLTELRAVLAP